MSSKDSIILNVLAKAVGGALLLLSSIVMARYFSKSDYGSFLQIMLIVNTAALLGNFGLPESIYFFFQKTGDRAGFLSRSLAVAIGLALFWGLVLYRVKGLLSSLFDNSFINQAGLLLSLMAAGRIVSQFREPVLISADKLLFNGWFNILGDLLFFLPTIIGPFFIDSLRVILALTCCGILATAAASLLAFALLICVYKRKDRGHNLAGVDPVGVTLARQLKYSLPIAAASYMGVIGQQIDQYLVSLFFTPRDYAVYSRGALRLPVLGNLQLFINDLKMPQYVKYYNSERKAAFLELYHKCIASVAKIKYPVFFFLFSMAPVIINMLYTSAYRDAVPVFRIYSLLLLSEITMYGLVPRVSAKTKFITISVMVTLFSNIIASLVLLPICGAVGAALGTLISSWVGAFYLLLVSCKISGISFRDIIPWKFLGKLTLLSFIPSIPLYSTHYVFSLEEAGRQLVTIFSAGMCYVLIWGLLMIKFGLITREEAEVIRKWLRIDLSKWVS